jgi:hypothetical protein
MKGQCITMKRVPDRKKLRREYLRKTIIGHVKGNSGIVLFMVSFGITTFFVIAAIVLALFAVIYESSTCLLLALASALIAVPCGLLAKWGWKLIDGLDDAKHTLYVPPATPDRLPAEEILVRGSIEPHAPQETLLRATVQSEETKAEELLRSSTPK